MAETLRQILDDADHRMPSNVADRLWALVDQPEDSTLATLKHSRRVDELLLEVLTAVQGRLHKHDASKLEDPEKATFDEMSPKLRQLEYGSEEYKESLRQMQTALDHHYACNRHHPEHFEDGVAGMTLVDVIEMLADWRAATERNANGDLAKSLAIQKERFGISDQLMSILENTAQELGWIGPGDTPEEHAQRALRSEAVMSYLRTDQKIHAIRELRNETGLGLKDAKLAVEIAAERMVSR